MTDVHGPGQLVYHRYPDGRIIALLTDGDRPGDGYMEADAGRTERLNRGVAMTQTEARRLAREPNARSPLISGRHHPRPASRPVGVHARGVRRRRAQIFDHDPGRRPPDDP